MTSGKRQSRNPKRRIAGHRHAAEVREAVAQRIRYTGSALHKMHPGDYGFHPPINPRPHKSLCDDMRSILRDEAAVLLAEGARRGLYSSLEANGLPKYVWSVDHAGQVYEAKADGIGYHGYRLGPNEADMRKLILRLWIER